MLGNHADHFFLGHAREHVLAGKPNGGGRSYSPPDQDRVSSMILAGDVDPGGALPGMGNVDPGGWMPSMGGTDAYGMLPSMGDILPPTAVAAMKEPKNLMIAAAIGLGLFLMLRK